MKLKIVDLKDIIKVAPDLSLFALIEIFDLFGIKLKFDFRKKRPNARISKKSKAKS